MDELEEDKIIKTIANYGFNFDNLVMHQSFETPNPHPGLSLRFQVAG